MHLGTCGVQMCPDAQADPVNVSGLHKTKVKSFYKHRCMGSAPHIRAALAASHAYAWGYGALG